MNMREGQGNFDFPTIEDTIPCECETCGEPIPWTADLCSLCYLKTADVQGEA